MRLPTTSLEWVKTLRRTLLEKHVSSGTPPTSPLPLAELLTSLFFVPKDVAAVIARALVWAPSSRPTAAEIGAEKAWFWGLRE